MLRITFANNITYTVHEDTVVYPWGGVNTRNKMEIHMPEEAMSLEDFIALVSNENNTVTMRHVSIDDRGKVVYDNTYQYYTVLAEVGKRRCDMIDLETGEVTSAFHLVAVLEQLSQTERKLLELTKK